MVNIPGPGLVEAIVNGDVDALSGWDTVVYDAKKRMPGKADIVAGPEQPGLAMGFGSQGQRRPNPPSR